MKYEHLVSAIGQEKAEMLQNKTVSILGLGGIGSTLADLLVRSGINVRIIEKGRVNEEDMDRLSLFSNEDLTKFKATQAKKILSKVNPDVTVKSFNEEITPDTLFLLDADIICDCSGDGEVTEHVSAYCADKGTPCVFGVVRDTKCIVVAAHDAKSVSDQLKNVDHEQTQGLYPAATHMVAGFMYMKVLKILTDQKPKRGVLIYDVFKQQFEDKKGKKK